MTVRVGIIEAHTVVLYGIISVLHSSAALRVRATGPTVADLISARQRLDVVLLGMSLPDASRPQENVRALRPMGVPIVAFSPDIRSPKIREAVSAGAVGGISTRADREQIIDAVRQVASGRGLPLVHSAVDPVPELLLASARLSRRENEVLSMYASGQTAAQVARHLHLSTSTVIDHIRRIRSKYLAAGREAPTKVDLFRRAVEDRLIEEGGEIIALQGAALS